MSAQAFMRFHYNFPPCIIDLANTMGTNAISRLSSSQYILRSVLRLSFSTKVGFPLAS